MYSGDKDIQDALSQLKTFIQEEVDSVSDCPQCYSAVSQDRVNGFVTLCKPPHPIVWAFSDVYWPAKVMVNKGESLRVRYFGDHTNQELSPENCYKFSEAPPEKPLESTDAYGFALKVIVLLKIRI